MLLTAGFVCGHTGCAFLSTAADKHSDIVSSVSVYGLEIIFVVLSMSG